MSGADGGGGPSTNVENPNVQQENFRRMMDEQRYKNDTPPLVIAPQEFPVLKNQATQRTDFESYTLNQMVDLVDGTKPSDLESASDALYAASSAIRKAGAWLAREADGVSWQGKAANSFKKWAVELGQDTEKMGEYAEAVSTELTILSTSLTKVKNSMPERSSDEPGGSFATEGDKKGVESIPTPARVDGNKNYKYEKDRESAIELMNQLGSYYSVSQQAFDRAEYNLPSFRSVPKNIEVPPATFAPTPPGSGQGAQSADAVGAGSAVGGGTGAVPTQGVPSVPSSGSDAIGSSTPSGSPSGGGFEPPSRPDSAVSTDINTTAPPMPTSTGGGPPTAPPSSAGPPTGTPPMAGPPTGFPPPTMAPPPGKIPQGPVAKPASPPPVRGGLGRPSPVAPGPAGRPGPVGPGPLGRGQTGPDGRTVGTPRTPGGMGRPGMMGPGATAPGGGTGLGNGSVQGGGARAARPGGIVGGTPTRPTPGPNTSGLPRGTVIGGEGGPTGRGPMGTTPTGGTGRGSGAGAGQNGPGRRLTSSPGGVVGTPRTGTPGQGRGSRQFTQGGSGLVRNGQVGGMMPPAGSVNARERSRNASRRPDYLTEDEETWSAGQRRAAPPVIE